MRKELARGKRGIVFLDTWKGRTAAVKVKHPKAKTDRLRNEADMLRRLNREGIGPRLYAFREGELWMEYVEGERFEGFLEHATEKQARSVVRQALEQAMLLDRLGINKEEMHRPYKHLLVRKGKLVMIDFERAHCCEKTQNTRQLLQYLSNARVAKLLERCGMRVSRERCIRLARKLPKDAENLFACLTEHSGDT